MTIVNEIVKTLPISEAVTFLLEDLPLLAHSCDLSFAEQHLMHAMPLSYLIPDPPSSLLSLLLSLSLKLNSAPPDVSC